MVVYLETAFLENFAIDGTLLFLSVKCARGRVSVLRLCLASALGAVFAIVFPLFKLPMLAAYAVKILSGIAIAAVAAPKGFKKTVITTAAFWALTFAFGGLLTAAYSFFGVEYTEGNGYLVESAPVALVLCSAVVFAAAAGYGIRALYKYRAVQKNVLPCRLKVQGKEVSWRGYADSGNLLSYRGKPVCVVSAAAIFALFGKKPQAVGRIEVTTVNGKRESPVFLPDELTVNGKSVGEVYLTVGNVTGKDYQIILHSALTEGVHEGSQHLTTLAQGRDVQ